MKEIIVTEEMKTRILLSSTGDTICMKKTDRNTFEEWYIIKKTKAKITIAIVKYKWDGRELYEAHRTLFNYSPT